MVAMRSTYIKYLRLPLAAILLTVSICLSSCGETWDWMWSRNPGGPLDTNDLILGGGNAEQETDLVFEGAVEYTGEVHSGTEIYYLGEAGHENRNRIIVIDAGHQQKAMDALEPCGPDSTEMKAKVSAGVTGVSTKQKEYELNLRVALLLRDELIRRGYSVVMIRETNNVSISNMERARIANKYNAAAYIRIHANGSEDTTLRGAMTICQSASNPYPTCAATYEDSRLLSEIILDQFCSQTGIRQLSVREMDTMTGINWSQVPTTIVEMGYLSNQSEDKLMKSDYFRQEAAMGMANGLDVYFDRLEELEQETEPTTDIPDSLQPGENTEPSVTTPAETEPAQSETSAIPDETDEPSADTTTPEGDSNAPTSGNGSTSGGDQSGEPVDPTPDGDPDPETPDNGGTPPDNSLEGTPGVTPDNGGSDNATPTPPDQNVTPSAPLPENGDIPLSQT